MRIAVSLRRRRASVVNRCGRSGGVLQLLLEWFCQFINNPASTLQQLLQKNMLGLGLPLLNLTQPVHILFLMDINQVCLI